LSARGILGVWAVLVGASQIVRALLRVLAPVVRAAETHVLIASALELANTLIPSVQSATVLSFGSP
jgi:hypothetical protein